MRYPIDHACKGKKPRGKEGVCTPSSNARYRDRPKDEPENIESHEACEGQGFQVRQTGQAHMKAGENALLEGSLLSVMPCRQDLA